jgi:hypothetical protein
MQGRARASPQRSRALARQLGKGHWLCKGAPNCTQGCVRSFKSPSKRWGPAIAGSLRAGHIRGCQPRAADGAVEGGLVQV